MTGFLGQRFSSADFSEFQRLFMSEAALGYSLNTSAPTLRGNDGGAAAFGGAEAMLDAELVEAMGANIATEFWGFAGTDSPPQKLWLDWLALLANTSDERVPRVFSTSYGEDEPYIAADFARRINGEFIKAGARGISLLFSSGDSGAAGSDPQSRGCPAGKFVPKWPAASPFVTSVGGTDGEGTAAHLSSGGFSNRYARPGWQQAAVAAYLGSTNLTDDVRSHINRTSGRGFPDLAAQASAKIVSKRFPKTVEGTSCSCPMVAGIISLINDRRLAAGKATLGFLNPFLYAHPNTLKGATVGVGGGCGTFGADGFPALRGWDAVTGLGEPDYLALVQAALALP